MSEEYVEALRQILIDQEFEFTEEGAVFHLELPGVRKLKTPVPLEVGPHSIIVDAFVCRRPDENFEDVYRWLLERNPRMFGFAFGVDALGDIYLSARLPHAIITPEEIDRLLGSALSYADDAFNRILEMGFATSIRKEWEWRLSTGESTANLAAFESLRPRN
ncbi:MAG TPA: YbjN domain-containing protein [Marmoricola sp.]|nr:YbjN domain-containing protein [Marmoricola sp.]